MTDLGGVFVGRPRCISATPNGSVACFAVNINSQLGANKYTPPGWATSNWHGWSNLFGSVAQDWFSCVTTFFSGTLQHFTCAAIATVDHTLYAINYDGAAWGQWTQIDGKTTLVGRPECTVVNSTLDRNVITCVALGPDRLPRYTEFTP
jgi:hypothetical protein